MSSLALVRHAQASFFADDYDQLSPLGHQQARLLGEFWGRSGLQIDEIYVGPRQRHQQTAMAVAAGFQQVGRPSPQPIVLQELDEYDLSGVLKCLAPNLAKSNSEFAALIERQRHGVTSEEQVRNFQRMFEPLMLHWQSARESCEGVESWPAFRARVERGLKVMTGSSSRGRSIVAFSSGGFIGTAAQLVLGAPARAALELNWRIRNAAVTEFVFTRERITLDTFNCFTHLPQAELVTYR